MPTTVSNAAAGSPVRSATLRTSTTTTTAARTKSRSSATCTGSFSRRSGGGDGRRSGARPQAGQDPVPIGSDPLERGQLGLLVGPAEHQQRGDPLVQITGGQPQVGGPV